MNMTQPRFVCMILCFFSTFCFSSNTDTIFTGKMVSLTSSPQILETSPINIANYLKEITSLKKHSETDQTLSFVSKEPRSNSIEEVRIEFGKTRANTRQKWKFRYFISKIRVSDESEINACVNMYNKHFGAKGENHLLGDEINYSWNLTKYFGLVLKTAKKRPCKFTIEIFSTDSGD